MAHFIYKFLICKKDKQNLFSILYDLICYFNTIGNSSQNSNNLRLRLMYSMTDLRYVGLIVRNLLCVCGRDITRISLFIEQIAIEYYDISGKCVTIHNSGIFRLKKTLANRLDGIIVDAINDALIIQPFFGYNSLFSNQFGLLSNKLNNKFNNVCKSAIIYYRNIFESCLLDQRKITSKHEKRGIAVTNDIVIIILGYMKPYMSQYLLKKDTKLGINCQFHSLLALK